MKTRSFVKTNAGSRNTLPTIAIDARKYFDYGIGTYIQGLIHGLSELETSLGFLAYLPFQEERGISLPRPWRSSTIHYPKYSLEEAFLFASKLKSDGIRIFHSPHYTLPVGLRIDSIVTIHDLIPLRFPEYFNVIQRTYAKAMMSHAVSKARYVLVDSEYTRQDILSFFRVDEKKVIVIHLGVGEAFERVKARKSLAAFREKYSMQGPFVLFVGNTKPHKGLEYLLRAFESQSLAEYDLAIVGGSVGQDPRLARLAKEITISRRIKELGRIDEEDLVLAYTTAELLVLPSLYEGFGLPAIEAMACGTPVVVANGGALPEIVGDAAVVVERGNAHELRDAITDILRDSRLRKTLIARGFANAKKFSWSQTARNTLRVYESLI